MSDLTEHEILDRLKSSLREAGQACIDLADVSILRGSAYHRISENLQLAEGCCRQLAAFRADWRWTQLGMELAGAKEHARKWLDGYHQIDHRTGGVTKIAYAPQRQAELFSKLARNLAFFLVGVESMATAKTGVIGKPILPELPTGKREFAPVAVRVPGPNRTKNGILLN